MNHWLAGDADGFNWSFFALFDCDMVPHPTFLQELLPAMLQIDAPPAVCPGPGPGPALGRPPPTAADADDADAPSPPTTPPPTKPTPPPPPSPSVSPSACGGLCLSQDFSVAFIATKQQFRNQPALDPLGHGQDVMYTTWEPALDTTDQVGAAAHAPHRT
jgi:hypothetical protein